MTYDIKVYLEIQINKYLCENSHEMHGEEL